ncbi:QWRF motif-containing protein 7 [Primulina tabacum]|uniref:QWRF motif-containing protein 7 n=1 Tax=Primulina tabacum TaxID=48773 RepID=UPI003F592EFF
MENPQRRRHQHAAVCGGTSPRLVRSKSGGPVATSLVEVQTFISKFSRTSKGEENSNTSTVKMKKKSAETAGGFVRFLPRAKSKSEAPPRNTRSASTSPSAWALSPGRSLTGSSIVAAASAVVAVHQKSPATAGALALFKSQSGAPAVAKPKSPANSEKSMKKGSKSGGVGGLLKYLRQKKVSPVLEEEYHHFSVMYNRLLQWRFANARAEPSMAAVKKTSQKKLFSGYARISIIRNVIEEKRSQIQKLKHEIKLNHILNSEMSLLNEWSRLEAKNAEAVVRVSRKMSAASVCLPLLHDSKADAMSLYDAMSKAVGVMDTIEATISGMHLQAEKACFILLELAVVLKQQKQLHEELGNTINAVAASLEVQEKSLRAHRIQLAKEVK